MSDQAETPKTTRECNRRTFTGVVTTDTMDKTISVLMERKIQHPRYKKYVKRFTKLLAHDEENKAKVGDKVKIMECRPISKKKNFRLVQILEVSKNKEAPSEESKT